MEVIQCPRLCRVLGIGFPVHPPFAQFSPGVHADDGGLAAVDGNELVPFDSDHGDPVVPAVDAQESRISLLERLYELALCPERILPPYDFHFTVIGLRGAGELYLVRPVPPVRAGDMRYPVLVHYPAQHDKRILQGERSALPLVRLRIQSHRRGNFRILRSLEKTMVAPGGTTPHHRIRKTGGISNEGFWLF